ncbi:MAG: hypothetical protein U0984_04455 [Prosthecobacter sp.]|nr:hypothetical protein [Prosthecobacter sp.]
MPRTPRRWKRIFFWLGGLLALLTGLAWLVIRTDVPPVPDGVRKITRTVTLTGTEVAVDVYLPEHVTEAPLAIVAHGFSRSHRNMTGWGGRLAEEGFITAVLDQPFWAAHVRNGRAVCELADQLRTDKLDLGVRPGSKTVLIGMSMGGLTTLLAAKRHPVDAWVGLDPVDVSGGGIIAAKDLKMPCAILSAEPALFNWDGNPRKILKALPGPVFAIQITGSTHCDSEWPHDILGQLACGRTDESRRRIYEQYTIAFLRSVIFADPAASKILQSAQQDTRVTVMEKDRS